MSVVKLIKKQKNFVVWPTRLAGDEEQSGGGRH